MELTILKTNEHRIMGQHQAGLTYEAMMEMLKALVALRLVVYLATFILAFAVLAVWTLSNGSSVAGIAILVADLLATATVGLLVARRGSRPPDSRRLALERPDASRLRGQPRLTPLTGMTYQRPPYSCV